MLNNSLLLFIKNNISQTKKTYIISYKTKYIYFKKKHTFNIKAQIRSLITYPLNTKE